MRQIRTAAACLALVSVSAAASLACSSALHEPSGASESAALAHCAAFVPQQWYPIGSFVLHEGQAYRAVHDNPGYDPLVSTWFWEPAPGVCAAESGTCGAIPSWAAGTGYPAGSLVRLDGKAYRAMHDNPGYDPRISTWYWAPYEACEATGDTPGDTASDAYILATAGAGYGQPTDVTVLKLDGGTGALTKLGAVTGLSSAFYGASSKDGRLAYFVTEEEPAKLATFSLDVAGTLRKVDERVAPANLGEFVGMHPTGKWLAIPYYLGGQVSVHPIGDDGIPGAESDVKQAAPVGMAECHQAKWDPTGANLFVTCKKPGTDTIAHFKFEDGRLTPAEPASITVPGGVRHLAFAPDGRFAYGITEADTSIVTFTYDKVEGRLAMASRTPAYLDPLAKGAGSHVLVHPSGKFLFAGSRFDNAIVTFAVDPTTGAVTKTGHFTDGVSFPRNFDLDPSGRYLIVGNQPNDGGKIAANRHDGGDVFALRIDPATGALARAGAGVKLEPFVWYVGATAVR